MGNRKRHTTVYKKNRKTQKHSSQKKSKKNRKNSRRGKNKRRDTKRNYMKGGVEVEPLTLEELNELLEEITNAFGKIYTPDIEELEQTLEGKEILKNLMKKSLITDEDKKFITENNANDNFPEGLSPEKLKRLLKIKLKNYIKNEISYLNEEDLDNYLEKLHRIDSFLEYVDTLIFDSTYNSYILKRL